MERKFTENMSHFGLEKSRENWKRYSLDLSTGNLFSVFAPSIVEHMRSKYQRECPRETSSIFLNMCDGGNSSRVFKAYFSGSIKKFWEEKNFFLYIGTILPGYAKHKSLLKNDSKASEKSEKLIKWSGDEIGFYYHLKEPLQKKILENYKKWLKEIEEL